jgi:glycosyltransferase involved in cell wall biosynthesis
MKILIATGIYPPDIGGPATYVPKIAREWLSLGHQVKIVTYSDKSHYDFDKDSDLIVIRIKRASKLSNYLRYYLAIKKLAKECDVIYAFDHVSAGLPAALANKKLKKKFFIRIGGDFIWEKYLDTHKKPVTLRQYYQENLHIKESKRRFKLIKKVFLAATGFIFTTDFQPIIFKKYYNLPEEKIYNVYNPISEPATVRHSRGNVDKNFVFAGRFIRKNNLQGLLDGYKNIKDKSFSLVLYGEGPLKDWIKEYVEKNDIKNVIIDKKLSRQELLAKLKTAYLVIFPSFTDISPNTMLESISVDTPFVSSTEIGFDWLKDQARMFDPLQSKQLTKHLDDLSNPEEYQKYSEVIKNISYDYSYTQAAQDTLKIFNKK